MLRIDLRPLSNGVHELDFDPTPEDLGVDEKSFSDIHVRMRLDIGVSRVYVKFWVSAVATLECDRTLVDFTKPIKGSYAVIFVPPKDIDPEDESDNLFPLEAGKEEIDLTEIIRDTLLLSVPVRKIAPGAEDEDLPTTFGEPEDEDVIDPRWTALKGLRSDSDTDDR
jgi:uncharacterized protein